MAEPFVILASPEVLKKEQVPPESPQVPIRVYSDELIAANARWIYKDFMVEEIHQNGKPIGQFRVCRRWPDPFWDMRLKVRWEATFETREEAVAWGKRHTDGRSWIET